MSIVRTDPIFIFLIVPAESVSGTKTSESHQFLYQLCPANTFYFMLDKRRTRSDGIIILDAVSASMRVSEIRCFVAALVI